MKIRIILFDVGNVLVELGDTSLIRNHSSTSSTDSYFWETCPALQGVANFESGKTDSIAFAYDVINFYGLELSPEEFLDVLRFCYTPFPVCAGTKGFRVVWHSSTHGEIN